MTTRWGRPLWAGSPERPRSRSWRRWPSSRDAPNAAQLCTLQWLVFCHGNLTSPKPRGARGPGPAERSGLVPPRAPDVCTAPAFRGLWLCSAPPEPRSRATGEPRPHLGLNHVSFRPSGHPHSVHRPRPRRARCPDSPRERHHSTIPHVGIYPSPSGLPYAWVLVLPPSSLPATGGHDACLSFSSTCPTLLKDSLSVLRARVFAALPGHCHPMAVALHWAPKPPSRTLRA